MAASSFSQVFMRNPVKAAAQLAAKRQRIAELEAGTPPRSFETIEEHQRVADRLALAFRDASRCSICGHPLQDPESVQRGIGPDCFARLNAAGRAPAVGIDEDDGLF